MNIFFLYSYLLLICIIGCICGKKIQSSDDYYVAGRKNGILRTTGSLMATILGSSAILGSVDFAYAKGWAGAWFMLCGSIGLFTLIFFVKSISRFQGYNLPSLLGIFYGNTVKKSSSGLISIAWLGVISAQLIGATEITTAIFNISYLHAIIIISLTLILYTAIGGQLSIIKTDCIQVVLIFIGLLFIFFPLIAKNITISKALPLISEKFSLFDLFIMLLTYSTTFIAGPDIYSRLFCAKDEKTIKHSLMISALILIPIAFILAYIGIYGSLLYTKNNESILFVIVRNEFSPISGILLYFATLSAIMSSADTLLFTAGGLMAQFFYDNLTSNASIKVTRVCILILGCLSFIIALIAPSILTVLLGALAVYSGAFIIPIIWGMFGLSSKTHYVITAILSGGILALIGKFLPSSLGNTMIIIAFIVNIIILFLGKK